MSSVSNVVISALPPDEMVFERINEFFNEERGFGFVSGFRGNSTHPVREECSNCVGGTKYLEALIAIGAFNYFDLDGFLEFLRQLPWRVPESVQLLVKDQHSDVFTMYGII